MRHWCIVLQMDDQIKYVGLSMDQCGLIKERVVPVLNKLSIAS
jgi:hypothetical protein